MQKMAKESHSRRQHQMRERIAQLAARLIAEDGMQDYGMAKRKAARQLGAPDSHSLPNNSEVEQALREYQALYQKEEHRHTCICCGSRRLNSCRFSSVLILILLGRF